MAIVNLFVVGHPRSGTGTLDGWLKAHPDVFMGPKELHYFGRDLEFNIPPRSPDNYSAQFRECTQQKIVGESSTWYLASKTAASEIFEYNPNAKIIISLRNPVDWLHSLHSHQVFAGYEDIEDFEIAMKAETARLKGQKLPVNPNPKISPYYKTLVDYPTQIKRYSDSFQKDQILILLFDELKSNPEKSMNRIYEFLGLDPNFSDRSKTIEGNKKQRNANHRHRSTRLQKWIKSPPRRSILHGVIPSPVPGGRFLLRALHRLNKTEAIREPMSEKLREELSCEFHPMILELEDLIDQDLNRWNFQKD